MNTITRVVEQPNQGKLTFYIDRQRAKTVFDLLIDRLSQKGPPYNLAHVPQADRFLPENLAKGSVEHAIFLFTLCFWMRGGVESDTASNFLKIMHEKQPGVFKPDRFRTSVSETTEEQIEFISNVLKGHRLGQRVEENAAGWVYNMRKLDRFWEGDPRKLMNDTPPFDRLAKRIIGKTTAKGGSFANMDSPNGFMFFREKMTAMIAYFLMDASLVPMFYTPVPVDFHVLRLLTANGIIRVRGKTMEESVGINFMRNSTLMLCRRVTEWYCKKYQVSPIALCDSLWLLSRTFCRNNPGNSGYVFDAKRQATKIEDEERWFQETVFSVDDAPKITGRKRYLGLKWSEIEMHQPTKVRRLRDSCGKCPLTESCRYNISSGAYYVGGKLLPERLRIRPPEEIQRNFFDHSAFEVVRKEDVDNTVRFAKIPLTI